MTTDYKVTELFCIIDEFCKHFDAENAGNLLEDNSGIKRRRRQASLSDSEIMTILLYFHFGTFRNFKHYYLFFIKGTMKSYFPKAVSYASITACKTCLHANMFVFKHAYLQTHHAWYRKISLLFTIPTGMFLPCERTTDVPWHSGVPYHSDPENKACETSHPRHKCQNCWKHQIQE